MVGLATDNELTCSGDGWAAVRAEIQMTAVMENDVGCPAILLQVIYLPFKLFRYSVGRRLAPVGGYGIPHHGHHPQHPGGVEDMRPAPAKWRPEVADRDTRNVLQRFAGPLQFLSHAKGRGEREVGMAPGMVADEVAGGSDAAHQIRLGLSVTANEEEGGAHIVGGQDVEQARGPGGIGAIVKGEGQLAGATWCNERLAKIWDAGHMAA